MLPLSGRCNYYTLSWHNLHLCAYVFLYLLCNEGPQNMNLTCKMRNFWGREDIVVLTTLNDSVRLLGFKVKVII